MTIKRLCAILCAAAMLMFVSCSSGDAPDQSPDGSGGKDGSPEQTISENINKETIMDSLNTGIVIDSVSKNCYKAEYNANPISPNILCADPTAIEYDGRLYVYGTNDQQEADGGGKNTYAQIKSLVVFSTDDMVNWIYHGTIDVGDIAPWIYNSWAPSIASRVEQDGLTHFYLYFANGGAGVGVLTSTDPVGPWSDPLGEPLVYQNMPGLENCPAPFDPGVCIDENGVGWLTFGGGAPADSGKAHSYVPKIARLGSDMLSFDSEFVSIDAPYFCEANELNYIDGTYYYTYCNDWQTRSDWDYEDYPAPPTCSMAYLTTRTPLDADSWEYRGAYFYNAGENAEGSSGMRWANNHTHFCSFMGDNYIIHHTLLLEELMKTDGGYRSIMADKLPMNPETGEIPMTAATQKGVEQIKLVDPYAPNSGALMLTCADIGYEQTSASGTDPAAKSLASGAWLYVRGVDFGYGAKELVAEVKGKGRVEVRLDDIGSEPAAFIEFDCKEFTKVRSTAFAEFTDRNHNLYLVFSDPGIALKSWSFAKGDEQLRPAEDIAATDIQYVTMTINAQAENPPSGVSAIVDLTGNGDYSVKSSTFAAESEVLNLGFINPDPDAEYKVHVNSLSLETEDGMVEIPVNVSLNPASDSGNGLANGWNGKQIGALIYGTEQKGIFAAETNIEWIGYRLALMVEGREVPFTSITYNITVSELEFE